MVAGTGPADTDFPHFSAFWQSLLQILCHFSANHLRCSWHLRSSGIAFTVFWSVLGNIVYALGFLAFGSKNRAIAFGSNSETIAYSHAGKSCCNSGQFIN